MPELSADLAAPVLPWSCSDGRLMRAAVTTRAGGVSTGRLASLNLSFNAGDRVEAVTENRRRVADAFGAPLGDFVFCQQVHARAVTIVDDAARGRGALPDSEPIPATDALVTAVVGPVLAVLVADCVPIVVHDPAAQVLAVIHAGWRGTVAGVTAAAIEAMTSLGAHPADMVAAIGPCVSRDTYQVGDDVADAARGAFAGSLEDVLRPDQTGRYLFDLVAAARLQLSACGLAAGNIADSGAVTGPSTPFYSHRFEAPTGRFAALATLLPKDSL